MLNLVRSEIFRLKRQKLPLVLCVAVIAISAFSAFSRMNLLSEPGNPVYGRQSFADAFQDISMLFLIAVFAGFYIGSDFTNRTIPAGLAGGHRRRDVLFSKAFVFSTAAGLLMLLYPVTVCVIHTLRFGWGGQFGASSAIWLLRVAFLGSALNIGTACIYVCIAFLCRDIAGTICVCFAFPVVFSAISTTLGKWIPAVGTLLDYTTLSQLKYIVADRPGAGAAVSAGLSVWITAAAALLTAEYVFSKAEMK